MSQPVAENTKISPFLIYYLIISMQIGIGILGFQRVIAKDAGYDSWISVIIAGLSIHLILWMMYKILETVDGDMIKVHQYILGEKLGKFFSSFFIFYFCLYATTVLRSFIEVIQVWMFPDISVFWFAFAFYALCIYIVFGGFRTVTGIAFFGTVLPVYLVFIFAYALPYSDISNIQPIMNHSIKDLMKAYFHMSLTYTGYETLLFVYPFIKNPQQSKKWAHLSVLTTTIIYTALSLVTFSYFAEKQLQETIWPTLNIWKIVEMPFVERFEYIGIANWNLIVLPNVCVSLWIASRLMKQIFKLRQRKGVMITSLICLVGSSMVSTRLEINTLSNFFGYTSFALNSLYIPCLFVAVIIAKKVKRNG